MLELGEPVRVPLRIVGALLSIDVMPHFVEQYVVEVELAKAGQSNVNSAPPLSSATGRTKLRVLPRHARFGHLGQPLHKPRRGGREQEDPVRAVDPVGHLRGQASLLRGAAEQKDACEVGEEPGRDRFEDVGHIASGPWAHEPRRHGPNVDPHSRRGTSRNLDSWSDLSRERLDLRPVRIVRTPIREALTRIEIRALATSLWTTGHPRTVSRRPGRCLRRASTRPPGVAFA